MTVESIEDSPVRCVGLKRRGSVCRDISSEWMLKKADNRRQGFPIGNPRTGLPTV